MGHSLDGASDVEHCINYLGSQFYGDRVHRGGEDTAASKDDMVTDRKHSCRAGGWLAPPPIGYAAFPTSATS